MDRFAKDLAAAKERENRVQRELAKRLSDKLSEAEAHVAELERGLAFQASIAQGADQLRKEALEAIPYVSKLQATIAELEARNAALRAESDALCRRLEEVSRLLGEEELRNA